MRTSEVRRAFLEFFKRHGHEIVQSGPLVPPNDPTLLFANSGMVQFKDCFTGKEKRAYTRAASSQKCIRISGKHNDLEEVGPSPRHQTFFEMLGNFSFGDYFKEEAIVMAWDFLVNGLKLPKDRLAITYFAGEGGVPRDDEALSLWKRVSGFGEDRIIGLGSKENFWQVGDTGPCGPCSEIYFYNGDRTDLSAFGQEQTPEGYGWIEFWNLVFTQFDRRVTDGRAELVPLPAPNIDTGAGLERMTSIAAGKLSNYDVDVLKDLVDETARLAKKEYGAGMAPDDISMRVIADHARTTAFLLAEGILPDRTGREYVLRRVMRRAVRHGHRLGIEEPFLHHVALKVVDIMGDQYPELRSRSDLIKSVTFAEEVRFRQTVARGLSLLEERFAELDQSGENVLDGAAAFKLYDTYGFPLDLTQVICRERGVSVDEAGYEQALEQARKRSEFKGMAHGVRDAYREAAERVSGRAVEFTGYETERDRSEIVALLVGDRLVDRAGAGQALEIVVNRTPFYGEAGGQVGDRGRIRKGEAVFDVDDTVKPLTGLVVHRGTLRQGGLAVGDRVELEVDRARRERIRRNHSATHLLHWALRKVVGGHAQQKGSLVGPERLRFDFTHNAPLTREQLVEIERLVNDAILENHPVKTEVLGMEAARARGAMMIFEEKYGDVVRMLTMGPSTELCGGTHARATGDIGLFKIQSEQGVAAGVRRLVATTGAGTLEYVQSLESQLAEAARLAKTTSLDLPDKIEKLLVYQKALEKQIDELQRRLASGGGGGVDALLHLARDVAGVKVLGVRSEVTDRGALRELAEQLRDRLGQSIVLVGSEKDGKAQLVLTVAKSLTSRFRAGDLIRGVAAVVGGSGGGRPDMAQAGGTSVDKLDEAIDHVYAAVAGN